MMTDAEKNTTITITLDELVSAQSKAATMLVSKEPAVLLLSDTLSTVFALTAHILFDDAIDEGKEE